MKNIPWKTSKTLGFGYVDSQYLPDGADEDYLRDLSNRPYVNSAPLTDATIYELEQNGNSAEDWRTVTVSTKFDPKKVRRCHFAGRVRMGDLSEDYYEWDGVRYAVGLYDSTIIASDIRDNCAISHVHYMARFQIDEHTIITNIGTMTTSGAARFGTGVKKLGETEAQRIRIKISNENGGRSVLAFPGISTGDAWLWSSFRDDPELLGRMTDMADAVCDPRHGHFGSVGAGSIVANCAKIEDVSIGSAAVIMGPRVLRDVTLQSSPEAQTFVGAGVEIDSSLIGCASYVDSGSILTRVATGSNVRVTASARVFDTFIGDNSTISCGEIISSLIFPGHEQHHNNSFLCATLVLGQSNIAAGATIGSNHNSRAPDGEITAGRGFWPALNTSLKHDSQFASFTLVAKGMYPYSLNIPFPFSLISNNVRDDVLTIMPAYWLLYNQYALMRNQTKFASRDQRYEKTQSLEFSYLAPDTIGEMITGVEILEILCGSFAHEVSVDLTAPLDDHETLRKAGRIMLSSGDIPACIDAKVIGIEASKRAIRILKPQASDVMYRNMIHFACMRDVCTYFMASQPSEMHQLLADLPISTIVEWVNVGGQLTTKAQMKAIISDIKSGELSSWNHVHNRYKHISLSSSADRASYSLAVLSSLNGKEMENITISDLRRWAGEAIAILENGTASARVARQKDYDSYFRTITYRNDTEREAVLGSMDDNQTMLQAEKYLEEFKRMKGSLFD